MLMNKNIICSLQPFDLNQTIHIFENGKQIKSMKVPTTEFQYAILDLWRKDGIADVTFKGHKKYSEGIKHNIKKLEKIKYVSDMINIKVI